jgi:FixJ family two-component response regulator
VGTEAESATFRRPSGGLSTTSPGFIDAYDSFTPTTIILDTIMPGVDGNELVLWLAKRNARRV